MEGYAYPGQIVPGQGQYNHSGQEQETAQLEADNPHPSYEVRVTHHTRPPRHRLCQQSAYNATGGQPFQTPASTGAINEGVNLEPGAIYPQMSTVSLNDGSPGLNFNGYKLEPAANPIPEEFIRIPTGTSIAEPGSILDEESGRTYYNHHTGKYFFPNDAVSRARPKRLSRWGSTKLTWVLDKHVA